MKAILISIKTKYVAKILNGEKTIEIRKRFSEDYVGWVYIYCTKEDSLSRLIDYPKTKYVCEQNFKCEDFPKLDSGYEGKGKVVARFWCDKVEGAYEFYVEELCQLACISKEELYKYAGGWYKTDDLLAIHITQLEIFDKPKEISEFNQLKGERVFTDLSWLESGEQLRFGSLVPLTRAPQSWCYVEI